MRIVVRLTPYLTDGTFNPVSMSYKPGVKTFSQLVYSSNDTVFSFTFNMYLNGTDFPL